MSNFIVSARKYRPSKFNEVVGQQHVSNTLKNALQNDHLAHSFLFCGPRGVGKTTCARILAKTINCENPTEDYEACNTCNSCKAFNENASFNITELDAASNNSVEHIRSLIEQVRFQPQQGRYKVFIIDEVHMLSQAAFNAFLKTLEEPPSYAIFILATTEKHKIIPTILSRCQIFDFRRIQIPDMVAHLEEICKTEGIEAEKDALHIVAQKADGALRDALSIFDRIVSFSNETIKYEDVIENLNVLDYDYFFKIVDAMLIEDVAVVMNTFDTIVRRGFDPDIFVNGLAEHLRNVMVCQDEATLALLEVSDGLKAQYLNQAKNTTKSFILTGLNLLNDCDIHYKTAQNKRLHVEMAIIKMTYINRAVDLSQKTTAAPATVSVPSASKSVIAPAPITEKKTKISTQPPKKVAKPVQETGKISLGNKYGISSLSMTNIEARIKAEDAENEDDDSLLTLENLEAAWKTFADSISSQSARKQVGQVSLAIQEGVVIASVGSKMARQMILDQPDLMPHVRKALKQRRLALEIKVDTALAPQIEAAPKAKKPLSNRDIYASMREINPLIDDFRTRFTLNVDKS